MDDETQRRMKRRRSATDDAEGTSLPKHDLPKKTGRRRDEVWEHVSESEKQEWKCNYCGKCYSGGASRIKEHLRLIDRRGNITLCPNYAPLNEGGVNNILTTISTSERENQCDSNPAVSLPPSRSKEQAVSSVPPSTSTLEKEIQCDPDPVMPLSPSPMQSEPNQAFDSSAHPLAQIDTNPVVCSFPCSSRYIIPQQPQEPIHAQLHYKLLVKDRLVNNLPLCTIRKPFLRTFYTMADNEHNHEVPLNFEHFEKESLRILKTEIEQYIQGVKESWSNYGFTLKIHMKKERDNDFPKEHDIKGYTIYCPKGVIFLDANKVCNAVREAMKKEVTQILYDLHDAKDARRQLFQGTGSMLVTKCSRASFCIHVVILRLLQRACKVCDWLSDLLMEAKRMCMHLNKKEENYLGKSWHENPFSELQTIMEHKEELQSTFTYESETTKQKFWESTREVLNAINPIIQFLNLFDNFVPNIGYLYEAMEKVEQGLKRYNEANPGKIELYTEFGSLKSNLIMPIHTTAAYLNPRWKYHKANIWDKIDEEEVRDYIGDFLLGSEEAAAFDIEMAKYKQADSSLFTSEAISGLEKCHPVIWWETFGENAPLLRRCAVRLLSQPSNCLCHLSHKLKFNVLNFDHLDLLRLNVIMMEEFKELEEKNEIFKPIDLSSIDTQLN